MSEEYEMVVKLRDDREEIECIECSEYFGFVLLADKVLSKEQAKIRN